jgi:hypothetical protein
LLAIVFFVAEECAVARVTVLIFSFADFEMVAAAAVPLGWVFELEVEDIFLEATMLERTEVNVSDEKQDSWRLKYKNLPVP